jgi:AcrR family transcriptional regulator
MFDTSDRRVRRTQTAICSAFNHLVLTREFDSIRIEDILTTANVARSTFYQHYRGKDDVLCAVMGVHILEPLARAGLGAEPSPELLEVAHHVWENRPLARQIFWGSTKTAIVRNLAGQIERVLDGTQPASGLPVAYVASTVAHWQIAMLEEWLLGRHRFDAAQWAQALCRGARSLTAALTGIEGDGS